MLETSKLVVSKLFVSDLFVSDLFVSDLFVSKYEEFAMEYVDGFVAAVPNANKEKYIQHAKDAGIVFKDHGALRLVECWGDDVPDGESTSFPLAVKCKEDETVVFSWIVWPSREIRNAGMEKVMKDPRMTEEANPMPFDGKRLIYGGFQMLAIE